jgi:hypothetical protein
MQIIGGAIGPVIVGLFLSIYTREVVTSEGARTSVPNETAFNTIFLVGAVLSILVIVMMIIMRRRVLSMGMPSNK